MKDASQKLLPLYTQETTGQAIDFPKSPRQIFISEQKFLQLKWEMNYWKSQHKKTKEREKKLEKCQKQLLQYAGITGEKRENSRSNMDLAHKRSV